MKNMIKSLKTRLTMPKRGIPETTRSEEKGILKSFGSELDTSNTTKVPMAGVKGLEDSGKGLDLDSIMNGIEEYLNDAEAIDTEQEKSNKEEDEELEASGNSKEPEVITLTKEDETPELEVGANAKKPETSRSMKEDETAELDAKKPEASGETAELEAKKPEASSSTKEEETAELKAKKPEASGSMKRNKTSELDAKKPEASTSTKEDETAELNVGVNSKKPEESGSTKENETPELDVSVNAKEPETTISTNEHKPPNSDSSGNSKKTDDADADAKTPESDAATNAKKTDTDTNESKTADIDSTANSYNTKDNIESKPADVEISDSAKKAEPDVNGTTNNSETAISESNAADADVTSNTKEKENDAQTPDLSANANKTEEPVEAPLDESKSQDKKTDDVIGDETPPLDLSANPEKTQDVVEAKPTKSDVSSSPNKTAGPDVSAHLKKTEIASSKNEAEVASPTNTDELPSKEIKNKAQLDENQQRADSHSEPDSVRFEAQQQPSILDLDTEEILRQLETLDDTAISQLAAEIEEPDIRDAPVYIYTSLAGGGFHMVPRTNRLATILTANRIEFQYRDLGTDAAARATWKALAAGKQLPGVVQGDQRLIGDWQEIDDLNESARLRDSVLAI